MLKFLRSSRSRKIDALEKKIDRLIAIIEASPGIRTTYVEDHVSLVRLRDGLRLYIDSRDIGIGSNLMIRGVWEAHYTALVRRIVKPGMTCIDAGANFGYYSVLFGKLLHGKGHVFSFEPNPWLVSLMRRSFKANWFRDKSRFHISDCALGSEQSELELRFSQEDFGGGSLFAAADEATDGKTTRLVNVAPLDSFDIPVDAPIFVKIDTEGAEHSVLQGAQDTFSKAKDVFVVMEFTPEFIEKTLPVAEFIQFVRGMGFRIMILRDERLHEISDAEIPAGGYIFMSKGAAFSDA